MDFDSTSSSSSSYDDDETNDLPIFDHEPRPLSRDPSDGSPQSVRRSESSQQDPLVEQDSDIEEDGSVPVAQIPEWAQNLRRPETSSNVGRFSNRDDEFTRHMQFPQDPDVDAPAAAPRGGRGSYQDPLRSITPDRNAEDVEDEDVVEDDASMHGSPFANFSQKLELSVGRDRQRAQSSSREGAAAALGDVNVSAGVVDAEDDGAFPVTDAMQWQTYLESGVLVDETPFTQLYRVTDEVQVEERGDDDDDDVPTSGAVESLFKLFNPPFPDDAIATDFDRVRRLSHRLCRSMLSTAERIASDPALHEDVFCNIQEVHCDSQTRIVVQLVPHAPSVSVADIAAFSAITSEHVRVIATTVIRQLCVLHDKGLVHGTLHGGNALVHLETGHIKLTDGCGLMSCPVLSPDLSFMSPHLATHIRDLLSNDIDASVEPNSFLNDVWSAFYEDPYQESTRDDACAVAQLVALMVNGYPSRFGMSLAEAVSDVDLHPTPQLLSMAMGGDYFASRAASAGFTEEFLHSAQSLIDTLMGAESLASDAILEHPFLISTKQLDADADLQQQLRDYTVQIATEAYRSIEFSRANAGSGPLNMRLFRNSIFAFNASSARGASETTTVTNTHLPSGVSLVGDDTVVVEGTGHRITLFQSFESTRTTLILRNVSDATIVILSPFAYVVLQAVQDSSVALGPCRVCVLNAVHRCPKVAVAAFQAILTDVRDVELALHSVDVPICPDPSSIVNVTIVPYAVSYPGLTHDFDTVGLSQESAASLLAYQSAECVERRQPIELFVNTRTGHDYPLLRAMATMGKRLALQNSLEDVYHFSGELRDFKIVIEDVHGGLLSGSRAQAAILQSPETPSRLTKQVFPVIMIVDAVEDVFISDCENVTIVVFGAKGAINVSNVKHAKLFLGGTYVMLSDCAFCEVYGFALKGAMIENCEGLTVMPLLANFPGIDGVLEEMATATGLASGEAAVEQNLFLTPRVQVQANKQVTLEQRPQCIFVLHVPEICPEPSMLFASDYKGVKLMEMDLRNAVFKGLHVDEEDRVNVMERSADIVVAMSNMIDASILRVARTLCPARKCATSSDPTSHLVLTNVQTGVIHVADAVGSLTIVNCTGPLDVIVAAAQQVLVLNCVGITVQVACFGFTANHCRNCSFALHVNTEPKLEQQCSYIQLSPLNITCADYEDVLERASVQQHVNLVDHPIDMDRPAEAPLTDAYAVTKQAYDDDDLAVQRRSAMPTGQSVESLTSRGNAAPIHVTDVTTARALLRQTAIIAPPLQATCVGSSEAPFLESLEDRVAREEKRPSVFVGVLSALVRLASASLDELAQGGEVSPIRGASERRSDTASMQDDSCDRPPRPSARMGQRNRMGEAYDSSSDEERDEVETPKHGGTPSPPRVLVVEDAPPAAAPATFGSMSGTAADDDTSSTDSSGDKDSGARDVEEEDDAEQPFSGSSDEDEAYANRFTAAAAHGTGQGLPSFLEEVPSSAPPRSASPTVCVDHAHGAHAKRSSDAAAAASNPMRAEIGDFRQFLAAQGTGADAPGSNAVAARSDNEDHPEMTQCLDDASEEVPATTSTAKQAKLDLGFDDTSSDDEAAPRSRGVPKVDHRSAVAAMGMREEQVIPARRVGRSTIHADSVADVATPHDGPIDISENPLAQLRATQEKKKHPSVAVVDSQEAPGVHNPPSGSTPQRVPRSDRAQGSGGSVRGAGSMEYLASSQVADRTVIFLDIDGVLVPVSPMCFGGGDIDPACLKHLKAIVDACGGEDLVTIVLTSTWRHDEEKKRRLNAAFAQVGIPLVSLGVPNGNPNPTAVEYLANDPQEQKLVRDRVDEIHLFMRENVELFPEAFRGGRWLAIDDMNLGNDERMAAHFVLTDTEEGLVTSDVAAAGKLIQKFAHFFPPSPKLLRVQAQGGGSTASDEDGAPLGTDDDDLMLPLVATETTTTDGSMSGSAFHGGSSSVQWQRSAAENEAEVQTVSRLVDDGDDRAKVTEVVRHVQELRATRLKLLEEFGDYKAIVAKTLERLAERRRDV